MFLCSKTEIDELCRMHFMWLRAQYNVVKRPVINFKLAVFENASTCSERFLCLPTLIEIKIFSFSIPDVLNILQNGAGWH